MYFAQGYRGENYKCEEISSELINLFSSNFPVLSWYNDFASNPIFDYRIHTRDEYLILSWNRLVMNFQQDQETALQLIGSNDSATPCPLVIYPIHPTIFLPNSYLC